MKIVIIGAGAAVLKAIDTIATYRAVSREDVTSCLSGKSDTFEYNR